MSLWVYYSTLSAAVGVHFLASAFLLDGVFYLLPLLTQMKFLHNTKAIF